MNNKILKRIFNILIILILFFNIDNVKAADSEVVAKITPTICEWENGANYIPTGGLGVSEDYQPFFGLSFNGIYYCASNSSDGDMNILNIGGHGTYFLLNPNPTKKIFFPVIYWDKKNYSNDSRLALSLHPITAKEHKTFNEEKQEIFNNVSKANSKYAYEECKKYCNSCHLTENGYAYYCNDYNLKKNYYTHSPLNFKGEGGYWNNFGWSFLEGLIFKNIWNKEGSIEYKTQVLFGNAIKECLNDEYDYCRGNLVYMSNEKLDSSVFTLTSGKNCWNYVDTSDSTFATGIVSSNVSGILSDLGDRYWLCESKADCEASCLGACVTPSTFYKESGTRSYIGALKKDIKAYYCLGTKNRNTKFKNGDSTENLKYFTNNYDDLKSMDVYDGDSIPATLGNIYAVGTGKITCEGVFGKNGKGQLGSILREIFKYMRITAVGLFVIFTTLDFIKAIAGSDDSLIKGATKNLTKRFMILLILLILPTLINIVLSIIEIKNGLCFLN